MNGVPPTPPSDDEVERRLRALKEGGTAAPPPRPGFPGVVGAGAEAGAPRQRPGEEGARRVAGEVVEGPNSGRSSGPSAPASARAGIGGGQPRAVFRVVGWSVREIDTGRLGLWIGLGLGLLGGYLVLAPLFPAVKVAGSLVLLVLGLAGMAAAASRRTGGWALYVGAVVAAAGAAGLLTGLGVLRGGGWTTLVVGLVLLGLAAWRASRGVGWRPLAAVGAILTGLGMIEILGWAIPGFPSLGELLLAAALVGVGWIVLRNSLRRGPRSGRRGS